MFSRRKLLVGAGAVLALGGAGWWFTNKKSTPPGFEINQEQMADAVDFLKNNPAFDTHAHPGRTFVRGAKGLAPKMKLYGALGTFEERAIADMQAGGISGVAFATVSDFHVLDAGKQGIFTHREFAPGEAWASFEVQIANMRQLIDDDLVYELKGPQDLSRARSAGKIGAWLTAEGGDFLEGSIEKLHEAHAKGLRSITLMHYRTSELGDIMTVEEVNHGLTPAGRNIVTGMNELGMMIDVAHASEATARGILAASTQPVMCSHTHIKSNRVPDFPRFISKELAMQIASGGGLIGAWPAGIGISDLNGFIDRILDLIHIVGVDHVGLGTDMDANFRPVMDNYRQTPVLVAGLLARGVSREETAKVIGGNFIRLWKQISGEG